MTARTTVLTLLATTLLAGCVTVGKSVLMDRSATPVPQEQVYVFLPDDSIAPSCERVAILNAQGSTDYTNESQMIDKMRDEAGKLGANAILLQGIEDPSGAERFAGALFGTGSDRDGQAIALWCPERAEAREAGRDTLEVVRVR